MGSEMCIRDRLLAGHVPPQALQVVRIAPIQERVLRRTPGQVQVCLLYTSDAADERSSVDLGGRRIIKKKNQKTATG